MSKKTTQNTRVKVLYQNLNGVWYAFAENAGELYIGKVPLKGKTKKSDEEKSTEKSTEKSAAKSKEAA
jgi:hypothetical protein